MSPLPEAKFAKRLESVSTTSAISLTTMVDHQACRSAYWVKQHAQLSVASWATGTARTNVAREIARMVLMNIILFTIGLTIGG